MKKLLYTLPHSFGFVLGHVVLYDGEKFRIEANTDNGGKTWDITYEEKKHETRE